MFLTGLVLRPAGISKWADLRSVASDLSPENDGKAPSHPVTVCHINMTVSRTMHPSRTKTTDGDRRDGRPEFVQAGAQRRGDRIGSQQKCPALSHPSRASRIRMQNGQQDGRPVAALRSKDDKSPAGRDGRTTFNENRRQKFEGQVTGGSEHRQARQRMTIIDHPPEDKCWLQLAVCPSRTAARTTHGHRLMRSGTRGEKSSVDTTKNDTSQNRLCRLYFGDGSRSATAHVPLDDSGGV